MDQFGQVGREGDGQRENAFARFCFGFFADGSNVSDKLSGSLNVNSRLFYIKIGPL